MKKLLTAVFFFYLIFNWADLSGVKVAADWWERPEVRPSQPNIPRDLPQDPTLTPIVEPTITGTILSPTLAVGGPEDPTATVAPSQTPAPTSAPANSDSGGSGNNTSSTSYIYERIGGPQVLGLSDTASFDLKQSDIILLLGVLCLLLYLKSKLTDFHLV